MKSDSFFLSKKGKEKSLTLFFPTWDYWRIEEYFQAVGLVCMHRFQSSLR